MSEIIKDNKWAASKVLENRVIRLRPIIRAGGMFNKEHDGAFMFTGTSIRFVLPFDARNNKWPKIFKDLDEQAAFELLLDVDLNFYKKENNFWKTFQIKITKDENLMKNGYKLDLSNPMDALRYRVLQVLPQIAPSWDVRNHDAQYKFAIVDEQEMESIRSKNVDKKKTAYIFLGKVENSKKKMSDFLRVYGLMPPADASTDWLKGQIDDLIENPKTLNVVLSIINDPNYEIKLLIEDAVLCGAIEKKNKKYLLPGGDPINSADPTLEGTVAKLITLKNETDDIYLSIKAKVEQNN
jgi:hypothetical protein